MALKSATVVLLFSAAALAYPARQFQRGNDVDFSEASSYLVRRSSNDLYDMPDVFARAGDKHAEYQRQVSELRTMYQQWCDAFHDSYSTMNKAADILNAQVALKLAKSPKYNAAAYNQAKATFDHHKSQVDKAKKNCDDYTKRLAALKPPRRKRSLDFEDLLNAEDTLTIKGRALRRVPSTIPSNLSSALFVFAPVMPRPLQAPPPTQSEIRMSMPSASQIASLSLHPPNSTNAVQLAQTEERIALLAHWPVPPGSTVLELGCGQGDCTAVLATAVGEAGRVVAVDPAPLSYGSPYTLGQAQSHLSSGPLGPRIQWVQASPLQYLSSLPAPRPSSPAAFDVAVLAHCLFYFTSPSLIQSTFAALKGHAKRMCVAEWSLVASEREAQPHVLAVLAQAALECRKPSSSSNVRTVLSPKRIKALAEAAGWALESEASVLPGPDVLDGQWEVSAVMSPRFESQVGEAVKDERERGVVEAMRDAVAAALEGVDGGVKGVRAMDAWVGVFV
ncbi:S-adenosyl-L-methionine-dependent methyltransferase [Calocera cornea HHB12733]|uniref:S-adenosyl-L-methionine-dependent methyltransferase n=1 Tax=Calocera cornea HHB12733 TaxID=1353952 RepID=A0A165CRY4_9BASI|nr:S-adenosyl-L-methionine-dependent methyltransferase [Calocera cornea HHB12733]